MPEQTLPECLSRRPVASLIMMKDSRLLQLMLLLSSQTAESGFGVQLLEISSPGREPHLVALPTSTTWFYLDKQLTLTDVDNVLDDSLKLRWLYAQTTRTRRNKKRAEMEVKKVQLRFSLLLNVLRLVGLMVAVVLRLIKGKVMKPSWLLQVMLLIHFW